MSHGSNYDAMADVYHVWTSSLPLVADIHRFYVELCLEHADEGPIVELGVGLGDVCVEVARRGATVVGVDDSAGMIELCRARAEEAGCGERLGFVQADFRSFTLPSPAALVVIPFHTIGHMVTDEARRDCLAHIRTQLAPGGRLVFDHIVPNVEYARASHRVPRLRAEYTDDRGRPAILWQCPDYDFETGRMLILAWSDHLDADGVVVERRYRRIDFSWLEPEAARVLLGESGFEVEHLWGDFARGPFDARSQHHVWVARRP